MSQQFSLALIIKFVETLNREVKKTLANSFLSNASKFEIILSTNILLIKCGEYLTTSDNQFGFKSCHSTDLCIYTLKKFIEYNKNRGTTVYVTFLDASKAFDRLNYWLLFDKLIKTNVPFFIIKLLCFWYTHQQMFVRWGNTISAHFTVANDVKQGGVISPILLNIYMDKFSVALNSSGVGEYLGNIFLNHCTMLMIYVLLVYYPLNAAAIEHMSELCY